jgi:putative ABC transport system substrate-binding protein
MPVVGFLNGQSADTFAHVAAALRQGLIDTGFTDGKNVAIEYRWADGQYDRLPALAADLVRRNVAVIAVGGGPGAPTAAKAATTVIPIVFTTGSDPVKLGVVSSLNRPGANITGVYQLTNALNPKRLGLLRELVPSATTIAVLLNPSSSNAADQLAEIQTAAQAVRQDIYILRASSEKEIDSVFSTLSQMRVSALQVGADPFFNSRRAQIVALASYHSIPAMYEQREFVIGGGLSSYGTNLTDAYRQTGVYVGRILKGELPSDLPVIQSNKFEFVINLKTAKALGLEVPNSMQFLADEIIE